MKSYVFWISLLMTTFLFEGCSKVQMSVSPGGFPKLQNGGEKSADRSIAICPFQNYTDTPDAGMRAANLVEGILSAKGYQVQIIGDKRFGACNRKEILKPDSQYHSRYLLTGGVSEWRYKTGIDGEPAVSLRMTIYDNETAKIVWSGTASASDWGNESIGVTAHELIEDMIEK